MGALHRPIENALDSEDIGDLRLHGSIERALPLAPRALGFEGLVFYFLVLFDLALIFGAGRGVAPRHGQQHARIAPERYGNLLFKRDRMRGRWLRVEF